MVLNHWQRESQKNGQVLLHVLCSKPSRVTWPPGKQTRRTASEGREQQTHSHSRGSPPCFAKAVFLALLTKALHWPHALLLWGCFPLPGALFFLSGSWSGSSSSLHCFLTGVANSRLPLNLCCYFTFWTPKRQNSGLQIARPQVVKNCKSLFIFDVQQWVSIFFISWHTETNY